MLNVCTNLIKNPNGLGYTSESILELLGYIAEVLLEAIENSQEGTNAKLLKSNIKKALYKIGDRYHNRYLDELVKNFEEVVDFNYEGALRDFYPEAGLKNTMSKSVRKLHSENISQDSYALNELEEDSIGFIPSQFLDDTFGNDAKLKNEIKQFMTHKLLSLFILDRTNNKIVSNIGEVNDNVRNYKLELFDTMINLLRELNDPKYGILNLPEDLNLFDENNNYTKLLDVTEVGLVTSHLSDIKLADLQSWHVANPKLYEAFKSWFILNNFDNFVNLILGKAITINPEYKNKMTDGDTYAYSTKSDNLITSWRTDDNIILEQEIGALAQSLINSTPFYKYRNDTDTGKYIKFEDFYRIITKIKDLVLLPEVSDYICDDFINPDYANIAENYLTESERQLLNHKSLRLIINSIRNNPQVYMRLSLILLNQSNTLMDSLKFTEEEKDKCYSIYKGIFNGEHAIYDIQNQDIYDHNVENYYELITQVSDSLFSVNFLQYDDENGTVTVRTLKDLGISNVRYRIESNIVEANSRRILSTDYENTQMKPYNAEILKDAITLKVEGIKFNINIDGENLICTLSELGDYLTFEDSSGTKLGNEDLLYLIYLKEVLQFIDELLHLGISEDSELLESICITSGGSKESSLEAFNTLMSLAATVYFNKYISNVLLKDTKGYTNVMKSLTNIFGVSSKNMPTYNSYLNEINLIPESKTPLLEKIANAVTILTGEAQSAQVRDAEGNMLSTQTLSRLLGSITSLHETIRSTNVNNIINLEELRATGEYSEVPYIITFNDDLPENYKIVDNSLIINEQLITKYFNSLEWTKSVVYPDGSRTNELSKNLFKSVEEYITYIIQKEYQHSIRPIRENETLGEYNNILSNLAISKMKFGNAAANFSLLKPGIYKGVYTSKEYKSQIGNKSHTDFTVAESIEGNFLYDFIGSYIDYDNISKKQVIGNGIIGLLPSVNSDKNTIGRALFDLRLECAVAGIESIKVGDHYKKFAELTDDELIQVIAKEFSNAYTISYLNVVKDYKILLNWLVNNKDIHININPDDDFNELNIYCENIGKKTSDQLFEWVNEYNHSHAKILKLIDLIHFIKDKKLKGRIKFNNTFRSLLNRYSDPEKLAKFMRLKESEFLKSIVEENVEINLFDELGKTNKTTPKSWLRNTYSDWVNIDNGKMIFATIKYNGLMYEISSKSDLTSLSHISGINLLQNPHELVRNPLFEFTLHPMFRKYNTFDYLFTLEFMISGVGSHMNHPYKKLGKVPIMWVHPAAGKTFTVENSKYKDQIMDWDVEFNGIRDSWIADHTNTVKGTPEYKMARNEYLINWSLHPDYVEFIKKQWNIIKNKAANLNKILVASPASLLKLFPEDFTKIITMSSEDFIARGKARGDSNPEAWKLGIENILLFTPSTIERVTLKPGEYLLDMLNSGVLNKELYQLEDNEMKEEAARFLAQHKRNVSYTAAMHEFLLGQINGIPTTYNMAVMDDISADIYTNSGDTGDATPFDGATFVNPWIVLWENNSLKGNKAGIDKKQFVHYYDAATGTGGIIKTAGFGVTNDRVRRYKFYRDMIYNMTSGTWKNADGSDHIVKEGGILVDFNGKDVDYGPFYFKSQGHYYMREISKYLGNNIYEVEDTEVDINGDPVGETNTHSIENINSNYMVWKMFGGHNSMELNSQGTLLFSEKSIELTSRACINYGTKLVDGKVTTADDVYQPMKHSDIHYMPTIGAIKHGAGNVNPNNMFFGKHLLNFMLVKMTQAGIQLDKEHHADNAELSLMTLVISAACAKGLKHEAAYKLYKALYDLTKVGTKEFRTELGAISNDPELFDNAITHIIMKAMLNSSSSDGDMMQAIAKDILFEMKHNKDLKLDSEFYKKVDEAIPYSDSSIFGKVVSSLTVAMTKSGIKTKMPGVLSVLCPAHDIVKFYKVPAMDDNGNVLMDENGNIKFKRVTFEQVEQMFPEYDFDTDSDKALLMLLNYMPNLNTDLQNIEMGYRYLITYDDGRLEIVHITVPNDRYKETGTRKINEKEIPTFKMGYKTLKSLYNSGQIMDILEWVVDGQDLLTYNVHFSDGIRNYQLADLDIVLDYFEVKELKDINQTQHILSLLNKYGRKEEFIKRITNDLTKAWKGATTQKDKKDYLAHAIVALSNGAGWIDFVNSDVRFKDEFLKYINTYGLKFLNRQLQITLNGLSKDGNTNIVKVDGKDITVDKDSVDIRSYGIIMPKTFKSNFGLLDFDNIEDIKNDPNFFKKRLIQNFGTKVELYYDDNGEIINNFHVELKRSNGNHIYLRSGLKGSDLTNKVNWFKRTEADGKVYRINSNNEIMYQMYSSDDEIYTDVDGNEIIVTSEDSFGWEDAEGNKLDTSKIKVIMDGNKFIDGNTKKEIFLKTYSGMLFYLDNLSYASVNISRGCYNLEFDDYLFKLANSTNDKANAVAKIINKFGSKNDNKREISDHLNNYDYILELSEDEEETQIKSAMMKHLDYVGQLIHTSFLESLKIIAARIPAQNQLSFMPMEVLAYDNPDINTAYVSIFQFYLQGSDLDIDAVSLLTFEIDKNGLFVGHSPYYKLTSTETKKASEQLPFPTGTDLKVESVSEARDTTLYQISELFSNGSKYDVESGLFGDPNTLFTINVLKDLKVNITMHLDNPHLIELLANLIDKINKEGYKTAILEEDLATASQDPLIAKKLSSVISSELNPVTLPVEGVWQINAYIINLVNKHNQYLNKALPKKRELIIKNYVTTLLFNIISDPINLMEAQSSVDVVTDPAKELAKSSPKATVLDTFTPGNVANKFLSISENMVGKDGIAICATGLKSFFALTELYQQVLNSDDAKDKESLLFDIKIGGKYYSGLANGFTPIFVSPYEEILSPEEQEIEDALYTQQVKEYLIEQLWASDAANDMSALLGLSVDNAKELILAKMNAGTASIGMYLYGLSIGVSFDDLYKIMTSPLAFRLTELTKGDYFNGESGTFNIMGAINYLKKEPKNFFSRYNNIDLSQYNNIKAPGTYAEELILGNAKDEDNPILNIILGGINNKQDAENLKEHIKTLKTKCSTQSNLITDKSLKLQYQVMFNLALNAFIQYIDDYCLTKFDTYYSTIYGGGNIFSDIEKLAMGGEEIKLIGKILRLNQEIKTNPSDLIGQVDNIEECIIRRLVLKLAYNTRHNIKGFLLRKGYQNDIDKGGYRIDLNRFITDKNYQKKAIDLYDSVKFSYNPLKILAQIPHYKGYVESLNSAYRGLYRKSFKFKYLCDAGKLFITDNSIYDEELKKSVIKNAENLVSTLTRLEWMLKNYKRKLITIPATNKNKKSYAFIDSTAKATPVYHERKILLGTDLGDANFKLWMETLVIPEFKRKYSNNKFIKDLLHVVGSRTNLGTIAINFGLPTNMLPRTDYEIDKFNEYKEAFNSLRSINYKDVSGKVWPVLELFYLYSLISNNGKLGPKSLHSIFEDYINTDAALSYRLYAAKLEKDEEFYKKLVKNSSNWDLAPFGSPYKGGSKYIKYIDGKNDRVVLMYKDESDNDPYSDFYGPSPELDERATVINGYTLINSNVSSNNLNYNYFLNITSIKDLEKPTLLTLSDEEKTLYPNLNNITLKYYKLEGKSKVLPILLGISTDNNEYEEIVTELIPILSEEKGVLPERDVDDPENPKNKIKTIDKELIENWLKTLKDCGKQWHSA